MKRPNVLAYLEELDRGRRRKFQRRMEKGAFKALQVREAIAYADRADFYDENGQLLPVQAMPKKARLAIQEITTKRIVKQDGTLIDVSKVKLENRHQHLAALEADYYVMPDNQKAALKVDVTSGGKPLQESVDDRALRALSLAASLRQRLMEAQEREVEALPEPSVGPSANGESLSG